MEIQRKYKEVDYSKFNENAKIFESEIKKIIESHYKEINFDNINETIKIEYKFEGIITCSILAELPKDLEDKILGLFRYSFG